MKRREFITLLGGAIAAWPFAARAQQPATPVIGYLSGRSPDEAAYTVSAFREGLASEGFVEGRTAAIEYRWAHGQYERLPAMASELINRNVDVIVASGGTGAARAAKAGTKVLPIVFLVGEDPVRTGLVASFNRPGGNLTGVNVFMNEIESKKLGLLHELVPKASRIAVLVNPNNVFIEEQLKDVDVAARAMGIELQVLRASSEKQIDAAFATLAQNRVEALLVGADPFFNSRRDQLAALAARLSLPAIYELREYAVAGGLFSYGPSLTAGYRQMGVYAGKVLKGAKPADLPVVQPTRIELVINVKTAKALGLDVPPTLLARADEVIE
jgi:putative ABC transport system substrate-binding protein